MSNLVEILVTTAERAGNRPALRHGDHTVTYRELDDVSARVAQALWAAGCEPGDRVGLMLPNVPEFPFAYYGALRAGCTVVPMNVMLKQREIAYYLGDPEAKVAIVWHALANQARAGARQAGAQLIAVRPGDFGCPATEPTHAVVPRVGDEVAVILYTSGTTGSPKGAMLTHDNLVHTCHNVGTVLGVGPDDVTLGTLPLFHSFGQTVALNSAVRVGACLTLIPRFDPTLVLERIERDRVTIFLGVPTMFHALLHSPDRQRFDTSSLRICVSGGASIPVEVLSAFEEQFGCVIREGYGLSETGAAGTFNPQGKRKPGSIGTALPGTEVSVLGRDGAALPAGEVGEIALRGYHVMKGYWNRDEATGEVLSDDGWLRTGDLGRVDREGYFYIVDRKKDMIIRGGYNVYPREIEEILYEHPAISAAAVLGIPDEAMGEEVGAAVVLKPGYELEPAEIRTFVKQRVAGYKYPRQVWFLDQLPVGPTGKVLKRAIEIPAEVTC
jgi:long-chain acyl-CoA synthetase